MIDWRTKHKTATEKQQKAVDLFGEANLIGKRSFKEINSTQIDPFYYNGKLQKTMYMYELLIY